MYRTQGFMFRTFSPHPWQESYRRQSVVSAGKDKTLDELRPVPAVEVYLSA
jgi:hypothetical protein